MQRARTHILGVWERGQLASGPGTFGKFPGTPGQKDNFRDNPGKFGTVGNYESGDKKRNTFKKQEQIMSCSINASSLSAYIDN